MCALPGGDGSLLFATLLVRRSSPGFPGASLLSGRAAPADMALGIHEVPASAWREEDEVEEAGATAALAGTGQAGSQRPPSEESDAPESGPCTAGVGGSDAVETVRPSSGEMGGEALGSGTGKGGRGCGTRDGFWAEGGSEERVESRWRAGARGRSLVDAEGAAGDSWRAQREAGGGGGCDQRESGSENQEGGAPRDGFGAGTRTRTGTDADALTSVLALQREVLQQSREVLALGREQMAMQAAGMRAVMEEVRGTVPTVEIHMDDAVWCASRGAVPTVEIHEDDALCNASGGIVPKTTGCRGCWETRVALFKHCERTRRCGRYERRGRSWPRPRGCSSRASSGSRLPCCAHDQRRVTNNGRGSGQVPRDDATWMTLLSGGHRAHKGDALQVARSA